MNGTLCERGEWKGGEGEEGERERRKEKKRGGGDLFFFSPFKGGGAFPKAKRTLEEAKREGRREVG